MHTPSSPTPNFLAQRVSQLLGFFSKETEDSTYVVLKSHLLAEEILREYVSSIVKHPHRIDEAKLSFSQLLSLCRALHPTLPDDWWGWVGLAKLNALRNQLAHRLEPENIEDKIVELTMLVYARLVQGKEIEATYAQFVQKKVPPLLLTMVALHSTLMGVFEIKPNWVQGR